MFLDKVKNAILKERGSDFLQQRDLKQKIRRELYFGLFPKTHKGKNGYKTNSKMNF